MEILPWALSELLQCQKSLLTSDWRKQLKKSKQTSMDRKYEFLLRHLYRLTFICLIKWFFMARITCIELYVALTLMANELTNETITKLKEKLHIFNELKHFRWKEQILHTGFKMKLFFLRCIHMSIEFATIIFQYLIYASKITAYIMMCLNIT